jgi:hypothetical protein
MPKREIDDVIDELTQQAAVATIVVPEREHEGREPSGEEVAPVATGPTVLVDGSLWIDVERSVECKPQTSTTHKISPLAVYCILDEDA